MAKVKIYTTPTCIWCGKAKEFFKHHKVKFTEIDVSSDVEGRRELIHKTHQLGVPVIDINGKVIIGYNEEALKAALKVK